MATVLESGKSFKRLVKIHGIEGMVEVSISHEGVGMRVIGTQKRVSGTWTDVVQAMYTPTNVPSYLMGEPLKFLIHEGQKVADKKAKKESGK